MGKVFISCKEATILVSKKEEGKLSFRKRMALFMHFIICNMCRLFAKQNKTIIKNIDGLEKNISATLSDNDKEEIIKKLESVS